MPAQDFSGEAVAQRGLGDPAQRAGGRIEALFDVQVEIEAPLGGEREHRRGGPPGPAPCR
jgi:hypothetical protein